MFKKIYNFIRDTLPVIIFFILFCITIRGCSRNGDYPKGSTDSDVSGYEQIAKFERENTKRIQNIETGIDSIERESSELSRNFDESTNSIERVEDSTSRIQEYVRVSNEIIKSNKSKLEKYIGTAEKER